MTHELAKQLKDAWFQSKRIDQVETYPNGEVIFIPTLSELIEACGDISFSLNKTNTGFWIESVKGDTETYPTPEEAVVNLWLALNKK